MADIEHLHRLLDWAEVEDEKRQRGEFSEWDQHVWVNWILYDPDPEITDSSNYCGTVCCLAGKVAVDAGAVSLDGYIESGPMVALPTEDGEQLVTDVSHFARQRLDLTKGQGAALFDSANDLQALREIVAMIAAGEDEYYTLAGPTRRAIERRIVGRVTATSF